MNEEHIIEMLQEAYNFKPCPTIISEEVLPCKIEESGVYKIKGKINIDKPAILINNADNVIIRGEKGIFKSEIDSPLPIIVNNSNYVKIENIGLSGRGNVMILDSNKVTIERCIFKFTEESIFSKNVNKIDIKNSYVNASVNNLFFDSMNTQYIYIENVKSNRDVDIDIENSNTVEIIKSKTFNLNLKNVDKVIIIDTEVKNQTYENINFLNINEKEREIKFASV